MGHFCFAYFLLFCTLLLFPLYLCIHPDRKSFSLHPFPHLSSYATRFPFSSSACSLQPLIILVHCLHMGNQSNRVRKQSVAKRAATIHIHAWRRSRCCCCCCGGSVITCKVHHLPNRLLLPILVRLAWVASITAPSALFASISGGTQSLGRLGSRTSRRGRPNSASPRGTITVTCWPGGWCSLGRSSSSTVAAMGVPTTATSSASATTTTNPKPTRDATSRSPALLSRAAVVFLVVTMAQADLDPAGRADVDVRGPHHFLAALDGTPELLLLLSRVTVPEVMFLPDNVRVLGSSQPEGLSTEGAFYANLLLTTLVLAVVGVVCTMI